ncbi:unnamed protein product, partial [Mesorhabditis spiculigera]
MLLLSVVSSYSTRVQGIAVRGRFLCGREPLAHATVKIIDKDSGRDPDDLLGEVLTDSDGRFSLSGATREDGDIEAAIKVYHDCNDEHTPCQRKMMWDIPQRYNNNGTVSEWFEIGEINLELGFRSEERDSLGMLTRLAGQTVRHGSGVPDHLEEHSAKLFINDEFMNAKSGKSFETQDPATGNKIADVAEGGPRRCSCRREGRPSKPSVSARRGAGWTPRSAVLIQRLANLMERDRQILASLETLDTGKPHSVSYAADLGLSIAGMSDHFTCTRHEPVRACGQFIPWNFQLLMQAGSWAPLWLCRFPPCSLTSFLREAGFPEGVGNILSGFGPTSAAVVAQHMGIDKAFTGSTEIGRLVMKEAQQHQDSNIKKFTVDLGGKAPNIIFADANLDEAVEQAHRELFFHQSQCCGDAIRTFVEGMVYDEFVARSRELARKRVVGDPFDLESDQGPQIDGNQGNTVLKFIEAGKREGLIGVRLQEGRR